MVFIEREPRCFMAFMVFMESDLVRAPFLAMGTEVSEGKVFRRDAKTTAECRERVLCRPRFVRDALRDDTPRVEELREEQMTALRRREPETNMAAIHGCYKLVHLSQTATDIQNEPNRE